MNIEFTNSFVKDLKDIKNITILNKIKSIILQIEYSISLQDIPNIKYLTNSGNYYRIRIGDYRIGIKYENNTIKLIRCLHRKDIYKHFPK
jgi:mRNA interferase RelE/StbE